MSGYPSRRPVSPLGGYYDTREVRPSAYDRERDAANLNRYGTISGNTRPPVGHPSERTYPDLGRTRRGGDRYMPSGVDISSLDRSLLSRSPPPRYIPPPAYSPVRPSGRGAVPHHSSPLRDNHSSSHRTAGTAYPVVDLGTMSGESRPGDILGRSPPPRNTPFDELDMLDAAARRSSRRSPPQPPIPRRSSRRPRANPQPEEMLPADEILGTGSGSRRGQYPFGLYGGSRRYESHSYGSERRGPW